MRRLFSIWLFWLFWMLGAGLASAQDLRPAELPPSDFPGGQYIDSAGCVFVRVGNDWSAKRGDDDAPLCGFPPSRSAWRQDAGAGGHSLADVERDLTVSLVEAGATGTLLSMPAPMRPEAASAGPGGGVSMPDQAVAASIDRALRAAPVIAARTAQTPAPNERLCTLLGMTPSAKGGSVPGADPTGGYCAGQIAAALPDPVVVAAERPSTGRTDAAVAGTKIKTTASRTPPTVLPARKPAVAASAVSDTPEPGPGQVTAAARPVTEAELVPADARYVLIGRFNRDGVAATTAAIRAMGYPVARQTKDDDAGQRIVLAGPFNSRERLIAALARLRQAGYPQAVAR